MSDEKFPADESGLDFIIRQGKRTVMGPVDTLVDLVSTKAIKDWWNRNVPVEGKLEDLFKHHPFSKEQLERLKLLARHELIQVTDQDFERIRRDYYKYKKSKVVTKFKDTTRDTTKMFIADLSAPVTCGGDKFFRHELEENEDFFTLSGFEFEKAVTTIKENIEEAKIILLPLIQELIFDDPSFIKFLSKSFPNLKTLHSAFEETHDLRVRKDKKAEILEFADNSEVMKASIDYLKTGKTVSRPLLRALGSVVKKNYRVWKSVNQSTVKEDFFTDLPSYPVINLLYSKDHGFELLLDKQAELDSYTRTIRVIEMMEAKDTDMAFRLWIYCFDRKLFSEGNAFWTTDDTVKLECDKSKMYFGRHTVEFDAMIFGEVSEIRAHIDPKEKANKEKAALELARIKPQFENDKTATEIEENAAKIAKSRADAATSNKNKAEADFEVAKSAVNIDSAKKIQEATIGKDIAVAKAAGAKSKFEAAKSAVDIERAPQLQNANIDRDIAAAEQAKATSQAEVEKSGVVKNKAADVVDSEMKKSDAATKLQETLSLATLSTVLGLTGSRAQNGFQRRGLSSPNLVDKGREIRQQRLH